MRASAGRRDYYTFSVLLLLQFVVVPFLGDMDKAGKLFLFTFLTLLGAVFYCLYRSDIKLSPVASLIALIWFVFLVFSIQAKYPGWALIQVQVFFVFLIYLYLVVNCFHEKLYKYDVLIDTLLLFSVLAAALGLYEYLYFFMAGPSKQMLIPFLLPPDLTRRVGGMYGQPNLFALFLSLSVLAFYYRYIHLSEKKNQARMRWARLIPFGLVCIVFFLTGSRAGSLSLSLVIGFLGWLVLSGRYLANDNSGKKVFRSLTLCLLAAFFAAKGLNGFFASGLTNAALGGTEIGIEARFVLWTNALLIFLDHPWLGIGFDNYQFLMNFYGPTSHSSLGFVHYEAVEGSVWAHNELLQLACEGGLLVLLLLIFLLGLFVYKVWNNFIQRDKQLSALFLYSHLFLLPFVIQSMFSWPLRYPPLLILFFTFLGGLLAQYPVQVVSIRKWQRPLLAGVFICGILTTAVFFYQEIQIGSLKKELKRAQNVEETFPEFVELTKKPYIESRILSNALYVYAKEALQRDDPAFAETILPYYQRLTGLVGDRWHWYQLALLNLKLGHEDAAAVAIKKAIDLMPPEQLYWDFLHHLNILKAERATGWPMEIFYPKRDKAEIDMSDFFHE